MTNLCNNCVMQTVNDRRLLDGIGNIHSGRMIILPYISGISKKGINTYENMTNIINAVFEYKYHKEIYDYCYIIPAVLCVSSVKVSMATNILNCRWHAISKIKAYNITKVMWLGNLWIYSDNDMFDNVVNITAPNPLCMYDDVERFTKFKTILYKWFDE